MKLLITILLLALSLPVLSQSSTPLTFTLRVNDTVQRIRNIGASGCWFSEEIGAQWPEAKKQRIAALLFSRSFDNHGQPKGIGLSAFRYNIGAGTTEQGDSSGIKEPAHRVECFLSPDGTYDWNKQKGYTWMLQQAKNYGVPDLIAFVNSPPVQFTKDGLGYKLTKDSSTNLRADSYDAYGNFLAAVIKHFDERHLHFNYISPVNEPQWDWTGTIGTSKQEGSPWTNEEICKAVTSLNTSLSSQQLKTKILITEAAMVNHLYEANLPSRSRQIASFWGPASPLYIGSLSHATRFVEAHGYFSENDDANLINTRRSLKDTLKQYSGLEYWQSEYCMLGNGYKDRKTGRLTRMDYALFLAKIIHHDFTVGNATAWHFWNSNETGSADNPLYFLIALNRNRATNPDTLYTVTKNLWALGHYSLFIRPGMYRIETERSDGLADTAAAQQVMVSAFRDAAGKKLVVNVINYTTENKAARLVLQGLTAGKKMRLANRYVTSAKEGDDLKPYPVNTSGGGNVILPARSITTFIFSP